MVTIPNNLNDYELKDRVYFTNSRPEIRSLIDFDFKTILDVGMGAGEFLFYLKKVRPEIETWGVEIEPKYFQEAKSKVDKAFLGSIENNLERLPDNYFEIITFNDVLEHLVDPWEVLKKIKTKLKTGGKIVASIPNFRYINNLKKLLLNKDFKYTNDGILDKTHLRFFTEKSIPYLFEEAGYKIQKIQGINPRNTLKFYLVNLLTLGYYRDTNYLQFYVVAVVKD